MNKIRRLLPWVAPAVLILVLWLLHRELAAVTVQDVRTALLDLPLGRLLGAAGFTVLGFIALSGYDVLGFRILEQRIAYRRIAMASFVGNAFSQALGHGLLTGIPIRLRLYTAWGVSAETVGRVVVYSFLSFWIGHWALAGAVFIWQPLPLPAAWSLPFATLRPFGVILFSIALCYLFFLAVRRRPVVLRGFEVALPSPRVGLLQIGVAALDLTLAASVFYLLLPASLEISFVELLAVYLLANMMGVASTLPGGLGVFDAVLLMLLPTDSPAALIGSVLAFRAIYYLLPLLVAAATLACLEIRRHRSLLTPWAQAAGRWGGAVVPQLLAATTFVGGALLLFSGATPAVGSRLAWLGRALPLPVIETSHFLGSLIGLALLILARGLQRRIRTAYHLAVGLLSAGTLVSLGKGGDYEEAALLALMLVVLVLCRHRFERRASLASLRLTAGWTAAIGAVLIATAWLVWFSYRHVDYAGDLWWRFALFGEAPRTLRALVGVVILAAAFLVVRLLRASPPEPVPPSAEDLERAAAIVEASPSLQGNLALLGDKSLLFDATGRAMLMYGIEGRSWVAMGGPVGPEDKHEELVWQFRDMAEQHGGWPVFYQVGEEHLGLCVEMGLSLIKLGEEGTVPLTGFTLEGSQRKEMRQTLRKLEKEGLSFGWIEDVPAHMEELRAISGAWLDDKNTREKGFSLGFFEPSYLERYPIAVVRSGERVIAFVNVWRSGGKELLSVDLMRSLPEAPRGVMDFLFIHLMVWGAENGYKAFSLGMAPLAGIEERPGVSIWNRIGALVYRHGEHFYNFQGLRQYKDKFDPIWEPRFLASPGGLALPQILTNVATLIAGGLRGVFAR